MYQIVTYVFLYFKIQIGNKKNRFMSYSFKEINGKVMFKTNASKVTLIAATRGELRRVQIVLGEKNISRNGTHKMLRVNLCNFQ